MNDETKLPDGSGFSTGTVRDKPVVYPILVWRNCKSAYFTSRTKDQGPPMSFVRCLRYAFDVTPIYWGGYWTNGNW
jgi:hypothetical protein